MSRSSYVSLLAANQKISEYQHASLYRTGTQLLRARPIALFAPSSCKFTRFSPKKDQLYDQYRHVIVSTTTASESLHEAERLALRRLQLHFLLVF